MTQVKTARVFAHSYVTKQQCISSDFVVIKTSVIKIKECRGDR